MPLLRWSLAAACLVWLASGCGRHGATPADGGEAGSSAGAAGAAAGRASSGNGGASGAAPDAANGVDASNADRDAPSGAPTDASSSDAASDLDLEAKDDATPAADAAPEAALPASGSPYKALAITTGTIQTCALLDNHRIKCWGANGAGELGLGDTKPRGASPAEMGDALPFVDLGTGRTVLAVSAGRYHTCAILDDGGVKCWGYSVFLGLPDDGGVARGDEPGEMGDKLPELDFGPGHRARLIGASSQESCAVFEDGTAQCWGEQTPLTPHAVSLGTAARAIQLAPAAYSVIALFDDGTVANALSANTLVGTRGTDRAVYIAGSDEQTCVIFEGGSLQCRNSLTAPLEAVPGFRAIGTTLQSACGLFDGGSVRCFREPSACFRQLPGATYWCPAGRLTDGTIAVGLGQPATAISTSGYYHLCVILADGGVKCWSMADDCVYDNGTLVSCAPPARPDPNLGASVDVVTTAAGRFYGAWHSIDLGTHP